MNKMFFLVSLFENKFGKAYKFYDEKGWHWLLQSDKPKLFENFDEAKFISDKLIYDIDGIIEIKEIIVYENVFENLGLSQPEKDSLYFFENRNEKTEISYVKKQNNSKKIIGLFNIDKTNNIWIFGLEQEKKEFNLNNEFSLLLFSLKKLKKEGLSYLEKSSLIKLDSSILFLEKFCSNNDINIIDSNDKFLNLNDCIEKISYIINYSEISSLEPKKNNLRLIENMIKNI